MKVELKNVKLAGGEETPRFEATLYIDGTRAAHVSNGGTGASCRWFWYEKALEAPFKAFATAAHPEDTFEQEDAVVYGLLDDAAERKALKRLCKKKTLARLPGRTYKPGEWSVFAATFSPAVKASIVATHGAETVFANEGVLA